MPHIYYLPDDQLVEADEAGTILETSLCAGIAHTHVCGGSARCSTCRVWIVEGLEYCAPRNDAEKTLAQRLHLDSKIRLACQTQVFGDGKITLRRLALDAEDLELINQQMTIKGMIAAIGEEQQIAILFADLRGFTNFSEALPAYDVIYVLNRYFNRMGKVISCHGGMINNYMGDGLMALFGVDDPNRATERAVRAAVAMQKAMIPFNDYLETLYHRQLKIGIGVHYGSVVVGAVGASLQSQQITAIGDAVNFASRIEAANKQTGTSLLISEEAYAQVKEWAIAQKCHKISIPGKSGEYTLYEVVGISGEIFLENSPPCSNATPKAPPTKSTEQFLTRCWRFFSRIFTN